MIHQMSLLVQGSPYEDSTSLPFRLRQKRFANVALIIDGILRERGACRILDVGGEELYWNIAKEYIAKRNIHITLVNLTAEPVSNAQFSSQVGDATKLDHLSDMSFDLVHSNSVIEHVGGWDAMSCMAGHIKRLAPKYFVQTPNFWFPFEPHVRLPFFHWLPEQARYRILMNVDTGFAKRRQTLDIAMRDVQGMALLDRRQFAALFPDAEIKIERFFGLTKSLMAIRV